MLLKLFQKTEEEGTHLNLFYEANTSNTKARQRPYWEKKKQKALQTNIPDEYWCKILHKIPQKKFKQHIKRVIHHDQVEFIPGMQGRFKTQNPTK